MRYFTNEIMEYTVQKLPRKQFTLFIERDNSLTVRSPLEATDTEIENFVRRKQLWLYQKFAERQTQQVMTKKREFVNGEGFLYLGRNYKLQIVDDPLRLKFSHKQFLL